jgi:hypothetical protein
VERLPVSPRGAGGYGSTGGFTAGQSSQTDVTEEPQ